MDSSAVRRSSRFGWLFYICLIITSGCASASSYVIDPAECSQGNFDSAILVLANQSWSERGNLNQAKRAAEIYTEIARCTDDYDLQVLASRASFWYAQYFLTEKSEQTKHERGNWYELGIAYGKRAMAHDNQFTDRIEAGEPLEDAVENLSRERIAALFWTSANLGFWLMEENFSAALINRAAIKKMIELVIELDSEWYCGAGYRALAVLYTMSPAYAGRDLEAARSNFMKSIALCPRFFETRVLMAEHLAPLIGGRKGRRMFVRNLKGVIKYRKVEGHPYAVENEMARRRAAELLARGKDLFTH
jgi:TRAP transporter T-component